MNFKKLEIIVLPSLIEIIIIFFLSFHLKYPMESGYLLWQHIELGRIDFSTKHINTANIFSYFPSKPLKRSSWLSDDIFYILYSIGGYKLIIIVKILILTLLFLLPFYMFGENASMYTLILPFYIVNILPGTALRPGLFALFLFLLFTYALYKNRVEFMSTLVLIWSFIHGTYIIGTILFLIYISLNLKNNINGNILKKWYLVLPIIPLFLPNSSLTIFKNLYRESFLFKSFEEWLPIKFLSFHGIVFSIYTLFWLYIAIFNRSFRWLLYGGVCLVLAIRFRRFIPFFSIAALPLIMSFRVHFMDKIEDLVKDTMQFPLYIVLFCIYLILKPPNFNSYFDKRNHPFGCENILIKLDKGSNILTLQEWVPYLYFKTNGKYLFTIDATLTQDYTYINEFFNLLNLKGNCKEELSNLRPDYILLPIYYKGKLAKFCDGCLKIEHNGPACIVWRNKCQVR